MNEKAEVPAGAEASAINGLPSAWRAMSRAHEPSFSARVDRLGDYLRNRFDQVPGWCRAEALVGCAVIRNTQHALGVSGGALEIGAHAGRFFVGLALLAGPDERSVAIDIFDDEKLRLDQSGAGASRNGLVALLDDICPGYPLDILTLDSLTIGPIERRRLAGDGGGFALVSVDGGHTIDHSYADFETAEALVAPGGVVMLDDYYSSRWPGVHEGVGRHFFARRPRIAPFAFFARKLWLTTHAHHAAAMRAMQDTFGAHSAFNAKRTIMFGHATLAIDSLAPAADDRLLADLVPGPAETAGNGAPPKPRST